MSEQRVKPPARRTGRALGGGAKSPAASAPPPTAELTPEQYAAEKEAAQTPQATAAPEPSPAQPAPAEPQPSWAAADAAPAGARNNAESVTATSTPPQTGSTAAEKGLAHAPQSDPASVQEPSSTEGAAGTVAAAEIAVRGTAPVVMGSAAFPVQAKNPTAGHTGEAQSEEAPSTGVSWTQGPGRPADIPDASVVLNQRIIARENLDSSVPAALRLKRRIKRFMLDSELDHLPLGDIIAVAMDEWLSHRGF